MPNRKPQSGIRPGASRPACPVRWAAAATAWTTRWRTASSLPSRPSWATGSGGRPVRPPAGRSLSGSRSGTTASAAGPRSATSARPPLSNAGSRRWSRCGEVSTNPG